MKAIQKCNKEIKYSEPFNNLFTQGMVCHETYKDQKGNWLYPDEVEIISGKEAIKTKDKSKVLVGPSESMSKSKKNTVDPEIMIKEYGADAVRWFILSDSPPEKDGQWSDTGVFSANKFLQKIWNLNLEILNKKDEKKNDDESIFKDKINLYVYKIDNAINNFQFNVAIANFYEVYRYFNDSIKLRINKKTLIDHIIKIMKLMIPFVPHLANECLSNLRCKEPNIWPSIDKDILKKTMISMVIQVNGKTRDVLNIKQNLSEKEVNNLIIKSSKANKYILKTKIIKTIFIKNKIINYIIKN
jgi:leucyl-tRNA synthetase